MSPTDIVYPAEQSCSKNDTRGSGYFLYFIYVPAYNLYESTMDTYLHAVAIQHGDMVQCVCVYVLWLQLLLKLCLQWLIIYRFDE